MIRRNKGIQCLSLELICFAIEEEGMKIFLLVLLSCLNLYAADGGKETILDLVVGDQFTVLSPITVEAHQYALSLQEGKIVNTEDVDAFTPSCTFWRNKNLKHLSASAEVGSQIAILQQASWRGDHPKAYGAYLQSNSLDFTHIACQRSLDDVNKDKPMGLSMLTEVLGSYFSF